MYAPTSQTPQKTSEDKANEHPFPNAVAVAAIRERLRASQYTGKDVEPALAQFNLPDQFDLYSAVVTNRLIDYECSIDNAESNVIFREFKKNHVLQVQAGQESQVLFNSLDILLRVGTPNDAIANGHGVLRALYFTSLVAAEAGILGCIENVPKYADWFTAYLFQSKVGQWIIDNGGWGAINIMGPEPDLMDTSLSSTASRRKVPCSQSHPTVDVTSLLTPGSPGHRSTTPQQQAAKLLAAIPAAHEMSLPTFPSTHPTTIRPVKQEVVAPNPAPETDAVIMSAIRQRLLVNVPSGIDVTSWYKLRNNDDSSNVIATNNLIDFETNFDLLNWPYINMELTKCQTGLIKKEESQHQQYEVSMQIVMRLDGSANLALSSGGITTGLMFTVLLAAEAAVQGYTEQPALYADWFLLFCAQNRINEWVHQLGGWNEVSKERTLQQQPMTVDALQNALDSLTLGQARQGIDHLSSYVPESQGGSVPLYTGHPSQKTTLLASSSPIKDIYQSRAPGLSSSSSDSADVVLGNITRPDLNPTSPRMTMPLWEPSAICGPMPDSPGAFVDTRKRHDTSPTGATKRKNVRRSTPSPCRKTGNDSMSTSS